MGEEWDVTGQRVLELGAGTGLAGIISGLSGAKEVVISDYPAPEVLANVRANVDRNAEPSREGRGLLEAYGKIEPGKCKVEGHEWGVLSDDFAKANESRFDRLLVADCLWMPWQHESLQRSIRHFMSDQGRAWVVAGFHTGRLKMAPFFDRSSLAERGLEIEKIWEKNAEGRDREWVEDRGFEDATERKRWLAIGVLKRKT